MKKVTREEIYNKVEKLVADGAERLEDVDVTANKITNAIYPIIDYLQLNKE